MPTGLHFRDLGVIPSCKPCREHPKAVHFGRDFVGIEVELLTRSEDQKLTIFVLLGLTVATNSPDGDAGQSSVRQSRQFWGLGLERLVIKHTHSCPYDKNP